MLKIVAIAVLGCLLASCAFTPHEVAITAQAPVTKSTIGEGKTITLEVIDDRESTVIGQRGAGMQGADITSAQVMSALKTQLEAGFKAKGFTVIEDSSTSFPEVEARLRSFKFFIETGFFSGAENVNTAIAIEAKKDSKDYDRTYRSSGEERIMVIPGSSAIDQKLNASLSDVLNQIFADDKLMKFLATHSPLRPSS